MDKLFIKKLSQYFVIIGAVTCLYNTIKIVFFNSLSVVNFVTLGILIFVVGIVYLFGVIKQYKIIPYFQIIIIYAIIYISFFFNPGNVSGLIFSIVNYLLLNEYKITKKKWQKIIAITTYIIPILISIFILRNSADKYMDVYLVITFFVFFIKMYIEYKSSEEIQKTKAAVELIEAIRKDNREIREIAKHSIEILNHQNSCIEKL